MESPGFFSGWGRTVRWVLLATVPLATFAAGYAAVPELRAAVDKLNRRMLELGAQLTQALGEKEAAEGARDSAELRAAREKQRADALAARIAQIDSELASAAAALDSMRRELAAAEAEIARLQEALAAKPEVEVAPVLEFNAQCPKCGHMFNIGEGLKKEQIRCRICKGITSAKNFWAYRAYVLNRLNRRK